MVLKEHSEPDLNIQSADSKLGQSEKLICMRNQISSTVRINLHIDITEDGMSIVNLKIFYDEISSSMEDKTNVSWR